MLAPRAERVRSEAEAQAEFRTLPSDLRAAAASKASTWPRSWGERLQCVHDFAQTPDGEALVQKLKVSADDEASAREREARNMESLMAANLAALQHLADALPQAANARGGPRVNQPTGPPICGPPHGGPPPSGGRGPSTTVAEEAAAARPWAQHFPVNLA